MGGLFNNSTPPAAPPAAAPQAPTEEATFKAGDGGAKKQKKLTAIKQGKSRLTITSKSGTKSGASKGF